MTENYIKAHVFDIKEYSNIIEKRMFEEKISQEELIKENNYNLEMCKKFNNDYILIDNEYNVDYKI